MPSTMKSVSPSSCSCVQAAFGVRGGRGPLLVCATQTTDTQTEPQRRQGRRDRSVEKASRCRCLAIRSISPKISYHSTIVRRNRSVRYCTQIVGVRLYVWWSWIGWSLSERLSVKSSRIEYCIDPRRITRSCAARKKSGVATLSPARESVESTQSNVLTAKAEWAGSSARRRGCALPWTGVRRLAERSAACVCHAQPASLRARHGACGRSSEQRCAYVVCCAYRQVCAAARRRPLTHTRPRLAGPFEACRAR